MNLAIDHVALRAALASLQLLEARATELHALRAFALGRLRHRKGPLGTSSDSNAFTYHQRLAERLGSSYAVTLAESA